MFPVLLQIHSSEGKLVSKCKIAVSEDYFNKCISTEASLLHRFDFKPLQTHCLRTLVSGGDVLARLPTGYRKSLVYQCLPRFAVSLPRRDTENVKTIVSSLVISRDVR